MEEKIVDQANLHYIIRASIMGVRIWNKPWIRGIICVTDKKVWFRDREEWVAIPIENIRILGRDGCVTAYTPRCDMVAAIDYETEDNKVTTALIAGPELIVKRILNSIGKSNNLRHSLKKKIKEEGEEFFYRAYRWEIKDGVAEKYVWIGGGGLRPRFEVLFIALLAIWQLSASVFGLYCSGTFYLSLIEILINLTILSLAIHLAICLPSEVIVGEKVKIKEKPLD